MLYPVFLHTYLDLVDQGAAAAAAALMARHRRRFTEAGGRTSKLRMQVLDPAMPWTCPPPQVCLSQTCVNESQAWAETFLPSRGIGGYAIESLKDGSAESC